MDDLVARPGDRPGPQLTAYRASPRKAAPPIACPSPPQAPPGASVDRNIKTARFMSPIDVYKSVRNHGPWDYKQRGHAYEGFGNFNYGAVMAANGWGPEVIKRGAGWAQQQAHTSNPKFGNPLGGSPYGDDPNDQRQIQRGIDYYNSDCMGRGRTR
jgi:hypothetical protein